MKQLEEKLQANILHIVYYNTETIRMNMLVN